MVRPGSNGGDANGDYAFVKYNKKIVRGHRAFMHPRALTPALSLGDAGLQRH